MPSKVRTNTFKSAYTFGLGAPNSIFAGIDLIYCYLDLFPRKA
jgi:hypothetical protein